MKIVNRGFAILTLIALTIATTSCQAYDTGGSKSTENVQVTQQDAFQTPAINYTVSNYSDAVMTVVDGTANYVAPLEVNVDAIVTNDYRIAPFVKDVRCNWRGSFKQSFSDTSFNPDPSPPNYNRRSSL